MRRIDRDDVQCEHDENVNYRKLQHKKFDDFEFAPEEKKLKSDN